MAGPPRDGGDTPVFQSRRLLCEVRDLACFSKGEESVGMFTGWRRMMQLGSGGGGPIFSYWHIRKGVAKPPMATGGCRKEQNTWG